MGEKGSLGQAANFPQLRGEAQQLRFRRRRPAPAAFQDRATFPQEQSQCPHGAAHVRHSQHIIRVRLGQSRFIDRCQRVDAPSLQPANQLAQRRQVIGD